jgi:hypothetical protein
MNTTYDQIYQFFINNISVESLSLPNTEARQYELIRNGISHFNNMVRDNLVADDTLETVDRELNNDEMLAIAHILKLKLLQNLLMYRSSIMIPFTKEIGLKNVGDQLKAIRELIASEQNEIEMILFHADDTTIME